MRRRAAALLLLCVALIAAIASDALHTAVLGVLADIREVIIANPWRGAVVFALFAAASAMLAFVSIAVVVPAAVYVWGEPLSVLLLWIGWIVGGAAAYGIARLLGFALVRQMADDARLTLIGRRVERDAPFASIVLLQLALPSEIPGYVLGVIRYPFTKYLAAVALGELPYALASVYLGGAFVESQVAYALAIVACIAAVSIGALVMLRRQAAAAGEAEPLRPLDARSGAES